MAAFRHDHSGEEQIRLDRFRSLAVDEDAQLRCQAIYAGGAVDRSPSGSAVSGTMAVLDRMGLAGSEPVILESLTGTVDTAYIAAPDLPESGPRTPKPDPS